MESSGVQACLQPAQGAWGTSSAPAIGPVGGSNPSWRQSNFTGAGRRHGQLNHGELSNSGFQEWYSSGPHPERPMRRAAEQASSAVYAEPCVQGAHRTYYGRRAMADGDAPMYRRAQRHIEPVVHDDRPEGKKYIPEPYGPPPRTRGVAHVPEHARSRSGESLPEPGLPRLLRPPGVNGLRETDKEIVFEQTMGRKVRVGQDTYNGNGRAGDKSLVYGAQKKVEELDPKLFKTLKDSPTFLRFCSTLPAAPSVSPHTRRAAGAERSAAAARDADRSLVATLTVPLPEGCDDD